MQAPLVSSIPPVYGSVHCWPTYRSHPPHESLCLGWLHARPEVTSLLKDELGVDPQPDTPLRELRNLAASKVGPGRLEYIHVNSLSGRRRLTTPKPAQIISHSTVECTSRGAYCSVPLRHEWASLVPLSTEAMDGTSPGLERTASFRRVHVVNKPQAYFVYTHVHVGGKTTLPYNLTQPQLPSRYACRLLVPSEAPGGTLFGGTNDIRLLSRER